MSLQTILQQQLSDALDANGFGSLPRQAAVITSVVYVPSVGETPQQAFTAQGAPVSAGTGDPLTLDESTRFAIASTSKLFTSTLVVEAAQSRPSILTDPIGDYLDGLPAKLAGLIVGDLLSYSSGLPYDNRSNPSDPDHPPNMRYPYEVATMMDFLAGDSITLGPVGTYAYSNLGFALAALGTPAMTGSTSTYEELLVAMITQSTLAMNHTAFYSPSLDDELPAGPPGTKPYNVTWPAYDGAGGIVSTLDDMTSWLVLNMGLDPTSPLTALLPTLQSRVVNNNGYGWFLGTGERSDGTRYERLFKDGGISSASSWIELDGARQLGVVLLSNVPTLASKVGASMFAGLESALFT